MTRTAVWHCRGLIALACASLCCLGVQHTTMAAECWWGREGACWVLWDCPCQGLWTWCLLCPLPWPHRPALLQPLPSTAALCHQVHSNFLRASISCLFYICLMGMEQVLSIRAAHHFNSICSAACLIQVLVSGMRSALEASGLLPVAASSMPHCMHAGHIAGHTAQTRMLRMLQSMLHPSSQRVGHAWTIACEPVSAVLACTTEQPGVGVQHTPPVAIQQPVMLLLLPDEHQQSSPSVVLLSGGGRTFVASVALAGKLHMLQLHTTRLPGHKHGCRYPSNVAIIVSTFTA